MKLPSTVGRDAGGLCRTRRDGGPRQLGLVPGRRRLSVPARGLLLCPWMSVSRLGEVLTGKAAALPGPPLLTALLGSGASGALPLTCAEQAGRRHGPPAPLPQSWSSRGPGRPAPRTLPWSDCGLAPVQPDFSRERPAGAGWLRAFHPAGGGLC